MQHEDHQEKLRRLAAVNSLSKYPAWETMLEVIAGERANIEETILRLSVWEKHPVDPVEIAYQKGKIVGMGWVIKEVAGAEGQLETVLRQDGVTAEGVTSG